MKLIHADCLDAMRAMEANSIDAIVSDPPYGLEFMGREWDHGVPGVPFWTEALRIAKPGTHLVAFGGTRTYHRLACAIEDAGWEMRDCLSWLHGQGFPKSLDVSKAIDKAAGAEREVVGYDASRARPNRLYEGGAIGNIGGTGKVSDRTDNGATITAPATDAARQWSGWGTALKPAWEPIILARKPLAGTVAANVTAHGTGAINVDACRIGFASDADKASAFPGGKLTSHGSGSLAGPGSAQDAERSGFTAQQSPLGRWPANVALDEEAAAMLDEQSGIARPKNGRVGQRGGKGFGTFDDEKSASAIGTWPADPGGGASRFFYTAKASRAERGEGNTHPTVKPLSLMRWLVRLVTPPGGTVLDPFAGSGTTLLAARDEGFDAIGIEREAQYVEIARRRLGEPPTGEP